jgi:hypothetical protein
MKQPAALAVALAASACSSVQSRMGDAPIFSQTTAASLTGLQGCITQATGNENVSYLPTATGGMFKSTAGPQDYVFWLLNIDDLGAKRRVTVRAVNSRLGEKLVRKIQGCL